MTFITVYVLVVLLVVSALWGIAIQVRQWRIIKQQYLDELQQPYLCKKCGSEEADTAIRRSAIVKRQKRAARVRKAARHA